MKNKKAISAVVSTVLLLLITIIAVSVLAAFIIPMIRNNLEGTGCIDILGKVNIDKSSYACYDSDGVKLTIKVGDLELEEIVVAIYNDEQGSSTSYQLVKGEVEGVEMLSGVDVSEIQIPGKLTKKTYVFTNEVFTTGTTKASVAGVVAEKICQESEEIVLTEC